MRICGFLCFFFEQKTAYEMRISDWSSDVCSSDLHQPIFLAASDHDIEIDTRLWDEFRSGNKESFEALMRTHYRNLFVYATKFRKIGRASCRERVCQYV